MATKKKNIWLLVENNYGTVGLYGHYLQNVITGEVMYKAIKKNRRTGIHQLTNTISVDLKTLEEARAIGVRAIAVSFTQSKDKFITNISDFFEKGIKNFDKGDRAMQVRLSVLSFIERKSDELERV
jgi:hypothetical protein